MAKKGTLFGKPREEVVKHPGAFSEKAEKAGKSTAAYAAQVTKPGSKASTKTKRQANLAKTFAKLRAGKAKFVFPFVLAALVGNAHAATLACPSGWLIGPTAQTATGVSANVIVPRGTSLTVEGMLTAGTATMQVEICCSPADCSAAGLGWAVVSGSVMTLALATPVVAVSVSPPACSYRANVTACSSCSVTAVASCGG